jgi:hypothetical protein
MTYSFTQTMSTQGATISASIQATAGAEVGLDAETIPAATDTLLNLAFPAGGTVIKAVSFLATTAVVLETNSTTALLGETISLAADVPLMWITGGSGTVPFAVTALRFYASATTAGTLTARVLYDPTP